MTRLSADVLEGFVNTVLRKHFHNPSDTPAFHKEIWELITSPHKQVAIAAPRYHAKSTAVTHAYTLASVLFRESRYVLIVSDTVSQSVQFLGDIKRELLDNEDLRNLFGIKELVKDTEDDLICCMEDGHLFRIQAKGSEQKLRGLKWKNMRPDLIIGDDMENDEIVMNKDRRLKFKRWFYGALIPCVSNTGKIRIVGTILHLDSLLENLMPSSLLKTIRDGHKFLIREDLKEYTNSKLPWKSIKYRAHTDDMKSLLWPEMKSAEDFRMMKEDYARQGLADVYSQEMLNIPLDETDTFFRKQDFAPMKDSDRKKSMLYYTACDLAVSQSQRADYSAFVTVGIDEEGTMYVVNVIKDRMDSLTIIDTLFFLNKRYKPLAIGIEQGAIEKAIGPFLRQAMRERDSYFSIFMLKPSADKVTRARSINARMRAGAVKFDTEPSWYFDLETECMQFPRAKHDDMVDALAYIGLMLDSMVTADTAKEEEAAEYMAFLRDSGTDFEGRSSVTGY